MPDLSRRRFFGFLAAPAIVRAASLMPVSVWSEPVWPLITREQLMTPSLISKEMIAIFERNLIGARRVNRQFERQFVLLAPSLSTAHRPA